MGGVTQEIIMLIVMMEVTAVKPHARTQNQYYSTQESLIWQGFFSSAVFGKAKGGWESNQRTKYPSETTEF